MEKLRIALCAALLLCGCASQTKTSYYVAAPKERAIGSYDAWETNYGSVAEAGLIQFSVVESKAGLTDAFFSSGKASLYVTESKGKPYVSINAEIVSKKDPLMRISRSSWTIETQYDNVVEGYAKFIFEVEGLTITRILSCAYLKGGQWAFAEDESMELIHRLNSASTVQVEFTLEFWNPRQKVTLPAITFDTEGKTHFETLEVPIGYVHRN